MADCKGALGETQTGTVGDGGGAGDGRGHGRAHGDVFRAAARGPSGTPRGNSRCASPYVPVASHAARGIPGTHQGPRRQSASGAEGFSDWERGGKGAGKGLGDDAIP